MLADPPLFTGLHDYLHTVVALFLGADVLGVRPPHPPPSVVEDSASVNRAEPAMAGGIASSRTLDLPTSLGQGQVGEATGAFKQPPSRRTLKNQVVDRRKLSRIRPALTICVGSGTVSPR